MTRLRNCNPPNSSDLENHQNMAVAPSTSLMIRRPHITDESATPLDEDGLFDPGADGGRVEKAPLGIYNGSCASSSAHPVSLR
ncbi:MAG: hypothetical protein M1839_008683 [Geoglossum umbratile]|nr:MAG: hypothetical protein M1839_008683 [Geoglossum umbratile]